MYDKIKKVQSYPIWRQLRDVRLLGFIVFGILVLLASWSGVSVIETNYELQKQVAQIDQQNKLQQLINTNLQLQNEYYNTDTYLELTARKQFGKGAPGETLLLVPKDVALAHAKALPDDTPGASNQPGISKQPFYRANFNAWMDFFFRKSDT